jgi:hypothetical protein
MHARFGYQWPLPDDIHHHHVIEDDAGAVIMAGGYRLVPEVTMLCDPDKALHPLVKLKGMAMLHDKLRVIMASSGHSEAISFVAPELKRFSRHLQREFDWQEQWPAFRLLLRKEP